MTVLKGPPGHRVESRPLLDQCHVRGAVARPKVAAAEQVRGGQVWGTRRQSPGVYRWCECGEWGGSEGAQDGGGSALSTAELMACPWAWCAVPLRVSLLPTCHLSFESPLQPFYTASCPGSVPLRLTDKEPTWSWPQGALKLRWCRRLLLTYLVPNAACTPPAVPHARVPTPSEDAKRLREAN